MNDEIKAAIARLQIAVDDNQHSVFLAQVKDLNDLIADHARLEAVVEKLPRTADGVPVVPGMELWRYCVLTNETSRHDGNVGMFNSKADLDSYLGRLYSTEQAAREAATGEEATRG